MEYTNTRQRTRWKDEIRAFAGAGWSTLTPDRGPGGECWERPLSISRLIVTDGDGDEYDNVQQCLCVGRWVRE